ncbi:MAG: thioesterase family protein [Bacteroidales bacterium]|nr:thioesterase family protein [Bacteroidales bacterium]
MIEAGIRGRLETIVDERTTAAAVGSGLVEVFATPMMVALMERTCHTSVAPFLDEGQTTVGTLVAMSHTAATPKGMKVWCESELTEVDGRRLVFAVSAHDECGLIGEGRHERFVVNKDKFQQKAESKRAQ